VHDLDYQHVAELIVQLAAAAGVIWGITKIPYTRWQLWLRSKRKDRRMLDLDIPSLVTSVERMRADLDRVHQELVPNHGTSLRDAINRIEALAIKSDRTAEAWLNLDERAMYMTDEKSMMTWCNRAYVTLTGRPKEELYGMGYLSTIAKHDLERVAKIVEDFELRGIFTNELDFDMQVPDNGTIPVSATNHVMHDADGNLTGIVGYIEPNTGQTFETKWAAA